MIDKALELHRSGRLAEADAIYRQILEREPGHAEALHHLGLIAHQGGNHVLAAELLETAIRSDPSQPYYYSNLGAVRMSQAKVKEAIECYRKAIALNPTLVSALYHLGNILWNQGEREQAADCYASILEVEPDHAAAGHLHAAMKGESRDDVPKEYVRELFDGCADAFDEHLVHELGYHAPRVLREAVGRAVPVEGPFWNVLDIGCGTGLCGPLFRDVAAHLSGVDLAPKMIDEARDKAVYDELQTRDLLEELEAHRRDLDLILAADVFIYVGCLEAVFPACRRALTETGLFAFSTEACAGESYELRTSGRFAHSPHYIEALARDSGFGVVHRDEIALRKETGVVLSGHVFVLQVGDRRRQSEDGIIARAPPPS